MTRYSFEPRAAREGRAASGVPQRALSLNEWRERLKTDPRGTVAELLGAFAERRSRVPEVEDFFWRVLVDHGTPDELVRSVLTRLRDRPDDEPGPAGRVLDLDREHRVRTRGRLRVFAGEVLAGFVRDRAERERTAADPVRLPQAAFARRGRWAEAAALFALEHDQVTAHDPGRERLARACLRYELARALHRVDRHRARALQLMESARALVPGSAEEPEAHPWAALAARLAFHVREWLGLRHQDAGRYAEAARELLAAAGAAPEAELAVAARLFAANALIHAGQRADAREILDSVGGQASRMGAEASEQWADLRSRLMEGLEEDAPEG